MSDILEIDANAQPNGAPKIVENIRGRRQPNIIDRNAGQYGVVLHRNPMPGDFVDAFGIGDNQRLDSQSGIELPVESELARPLPVARIDQPDAIVESRPHEQRFRRHQHQLARQAFLGRHDRLRVIGLKRKNLDIRKRLAEQRIVLLRHGDFAIGGHGRGGEAVQFVYFQACVAICLAQQVKRLGMAWLSHEAIAQADDSILPFGHAFGAQSLEHPARIVFFERPQRLQPGRGRENPQIKHRARHRENEHQDGAGGAEKKPPFAPWFRRGPAGVEPLRGRGGFAHKRPPNPPTRSSPGKKK
ncbi:MAG: hypothetical protein BWZ10_03084 [candidate division BRC1 bacterium ADurb.BinA364]|nr:MAG: hypothetical protein BWZ10_03084 [candidate division BRC1 bacterium ADurb.BinA364]